MTTRRAAGLLLLLFVLQLPHPGLAVNCNGWNRMGPDQKSATIDRMIRSAISGSRGRQYQVDRGSIARCLESKARSIEYDFDGACSDARTASMQALNHIFKDYIWSCAG
jgi:hypothetical protein